MLGLLILGVPVFAATGIAALAYITLNGLPALVVVQQLFDSVDKFPLLAVPFFILAGNLMNSAGITDRLYAFASHAVGHLHGGLGHVNIFGSFIFSGMSGTAMADAAGLGTIELKAMKDEGYDDEFAVGITAASATLGPIIPPSLPMILYGVTTGTSIGALFIAGIVPGLLMAIFLHAHVALAAKARGYPRSVRATWAQLGHSFLRSIPVLLAPGIILGGILLGIFTPTEAAVVAAVYTLLIGFVVLRTLTPLQFVKELRGAFETTAVVMTMTAGAILFGWVLVRENFAAQFVAFMLSFASEPWQCMLVLNVAMLLCGMFMDPLPILLIFSPIVMPVLDSFGIDRVQFGVVMVLNLMIGMMTPPIGAICFVLSRLSGLPLARTFRACVPFYLPLGIVLLLISVLPALTLTLPRLLLK
ncbi:MAG: TRAP transporter large permease [Alphaproteobacteria bacterium]|nr:TRAP transporter large permease [Alphaproteobacteria bacterium]